MSKKVLGAIILCFLVFGCDTLFPKKTPKKEKARISEIKGPLLAQVGDWAIGTIDFRNQLDAIKTLYPQTEISDTKSKKRFLQELIDFEILAQEAETRGLDRDKEVVDTVRNFKRTILGQKMLERMSREITVTDVEIENFYRSNKLRLAEPEERRIREIVVSTKIEAKDILIRLLQGERFSTLARSYSIADSKSEGGDLDYLTPDPKEKFQKFWEEAFTKEKGEISSYFKGPNGYYIIKVEDIRGGKIKPLGELRDNIRKFLRAEKMDKKKEEVIDKAKRKFKVIVNDSLLD